MWWVTCRFMERHCCHVQNAMKYSFSRFISLSFYNTELHNQIQVVVPLVRWHGSRYCCIYCQMEAGRTDCGLIFENAVLLVISVNSIWLRIIRLRWKPTSATASRHQGHRQTTAKVFWDGNHKAHGLCFCLELLMDTVLGRCEWLVISQQCHKLSLTRSF